MTGLVPRSGDDAGVDKMTHGHTREQVVHGRNNVASPLVGLFVGRRADRRAELDS